MKKLTDSTCARDCLDADGQPSDCIQCVMDGHIPAADMCKVCRRRRGALVAAVDQLTAEIGRLDAELTQLGVRIDARSTAVDLLTEHHQRYPRTTPPRPLRATLTAERHH